MIYITALRQLCVKLTFQFYIEKVTIQTSLNLSKRLCDREKQSMSQKTVFIPCVNNRTYKLVL